MGSIRSETETGQFGQPSMSASYARPGVMNLAGLQQKAHHADRFKVFTISGYIHRGDLR